MGAETQRKLIGAHSPEVLRRATGPNPDFRVKPEGGVEGHPIVPNSDGTYSVRVKKRLHNAGVPQDWSGWKPSTIAPAHWTSADMEAAAMHVYANGIPSGTGNRIVKNGTYKGVKWRVLIEHGLITASYPTGP